MAKKVRIKNKPKRQSLNLKLNIPKPSAKESNLGEIKSTKESNFGEIKSTKYDHRAYLDLTKSRFVQRIKDLYGKVVSNEDMINMQKAIASWTDKDFYQMTQVLGLERPYYDSDSAFNPFVYELEVEYEAVYDYIVRFKPTAN